MNKLLVVGYWLLVSMFIYIFPIPYSFPPTFAATKVVGETCILATDQCAPGSFCQPHPAGGFPRCAALPTSTGTPTTGSTGATTTSTTTPCSTTTTPNPLDAVFGKVPAPNIVSSIGCGATGISTFLGNVLQLLYIAGILIFVFMIVFSAVQWIASGGDKEKYGKARERLTHAVIGITLLGLAGVIITLVGKILNFKFFG